MVDVKNESSKLSAMGWVPMGQSGISMLQKGYVHSRLPFLLVIEWKKLLHLIHAAEDLN